MKNIDYGRTDGRRDYIFEDAMIRRDICEKLVRLMSESGYKETVTPTAEYFDVFSADPTRSMGDNVYKFTDEHNRLMALRCDCTVPIARIAATKLTDTPLPYRLFYCQNVFSAPKTGNALTESTQCGAELIGTDPDNTIEADIEILELAAKSMQALFGMDFRIELGHGKLFTTLAEIYNIDPETSETIRRLIETKNFASIESMKIPKPFKMLPKMFGNADNEDLSELDEFAEETGSEKIREIIDYIKNLIIKLKEKGYGNCLSFDLGLVGRLDYYTGIIFGGFVRGLGHAVLLGGRYDNLTANFGRDLPATGFGITVDDIFDLLKNREDSKQPEQPLRPIRIALTKGRLEKKTIELLEKNGVDCSPLINKGRKLVIPLNDGKFEVMLVKSRDVITYVEHGVCDLGIVGSDTITEYGSSLYELADLGFGKCRMALAGNAKYKNDPENFFGGYSKKVLATKFVHAVERYAAEKKVDVEIVTIEGSVELAPILGLADGIVDIVETGDTLRENGLEIIEEIFPISARIVANVAATKLRKKEIDEMLSGVLKV